MGDRVAFIGGFGQNQNGVAGSGSESGLQVVGRDHFPFPVGAALIDPPFSGVGDGSSNPALMSAEEALHFLFVVRNWNLSTGSIVGDGITFSSVDFDTVRIQPRESDLIVNETLNAFGVFEKSGGALVYTYFQLQLRIPHAGTVWSGDNLYPAFEVLLWVKGSDTQIPLDEVQFDSVVISTIDYNQTAISAGTLTITSSLLSINVPLFKVDDDFTTDITMEAIQYWPYATKPSDDFPDGEDVYDTATGAQLRDPLS